MKKIKTLHKKIQPEITLTTPSGRIIVDVKSVGTASISKTPVESVVKAFEKASKQKLFTAPEELNGEYPSY